MEVRGSKFLLIGGGGFIGSHIVDYLLDNGAAVVRIYDNLSRGSLYKLHRHMSDSRLDLEYVPADLLHQDKLNAACNQIDAIFHLGGLWLLECINFPHSAYEVNLKGTMNIIQAIQSSTVSRLIYSSSASVYGNPTMVPVPESHPFLCNDVYGSTKASSELLIQAFAKANERTFKNFDFVSLRYMNVYGPRQHYKGAYIGVVANMIKRIANHQPPYIIGDGSNVYDFIHVKDCARANILALNTRHANTSYNVGTGLGTKLSSMANIILSSFQSPMVPEYRISDRPTVQSRIADTHLAETCLGFTASISLEDGISDTVNSYMSSKEILR